MGRGKGCAQLDRLCHLKPWHVSVYRCSGRHMKKLISCNLFKTNKSNFRLIKITSLTVQVTELTVNQKHILEAIKYLDERIKDIIANTNNDKGTEVKDIITRQEKIDKIVVNNSDDILKLKEIKEETAEAIKCLEQKIREIDKDFEEATKFVKDKEDTIEVKSKEFGKTINCK